MRPGLRARIGIGALLLSLGLAIATSGVAQQSADQVVQELNQGAMEAYNAMDIEKAGSMLEEALRVAAEARLSGPLVAHTNLNLGIVYVGGLGDNDSGVRYFMDALCHDPSVQLDPLTSTPDVQSVFQVAGQRLQQTGCQGGPAISPGAAAATMPQGQPGAEGAAYSGSMDEELPPGWNQSDASAGRARDFKRFFAQIGLTFGMAYITPGMLADRMPPYDQIFVSRINGGKVDNLFDDQGNVLDANGQPITEPNQVPAWNPDDLRFPGTKFNEIDPVTGMDIGEQSEDSWVPDADSTDGYYTTDTESDGSTLKLYEPINGPCPADGTQTGPKVLLANPGAVIGSAEAPLIPSRYCVRVKKSGFANALAMRAALGYFITRDFSIAAITRLQFSSGEGDFSALLLGGRLEYMFTKTKPLGLMVSGFIGGTFGQIQAQPSADGATGDEPWIKSGLQGAHIGSNIRYRFTKNLGVFVAPELDLQFPTMLWNIDLTLLGFEGAL
jgi:hypothetical protein